jgi:hypothetical protein
VKRFFYFLVLCVLAGTVRGQSLSVTGHTEGTYPKYYPDNGETVFGSADGTATISFVKSLSGTDTRYRLTITLSVTASDSPMHVWAKYSYFNPAGVKQYTQTLQQRNQNGTETYADMDVHISPGYKGELIVEAYDGPRDAPIVKRNQIFVFPIGEEPPEKRQFMTLTNTGTRAVEYAIVRNGEIVGTVVVAPGATVPYSFVAEVGDVISAFARYPDIEFANGEWTHVPGSVYSVPVLAPAPAQNPVAQPAGSPPATGVTAITSPVPAPPASAPPGSGPVWRSGGGGTSTDGLTNAVYREGVEKALEALKTSQGEIVATKTEEQRKAGEVAAGTIASTSGEAKTTAVGVFDGLIVDAPPVATGGVVPDFSITFPASFGGKTINLNPFLSSRFGNVMSWFRSAVGWLALAALAVWITAEMGVWVRGVNTVQQARGNAVVGGTGAQATSLIAAGLMSAAIVVALTALVGWSFGGLAIPSLLAGLGVSPVDSMPGAALWMLDQCFPVGLLITCFVARAGFSLYASVLYAGVAALVRFFVP